MKAILFDLDGVFYEEGQMVPGAADVIDWVRNHDIPHLFLTNTTSRDRQGLLEKLQGFGIQTSTDKLLTPAVAAVAWLQKHVREKTALFVPQAVESEFATLDPLTGIEDSDRQDIGAVVLGDLGQRWDYRLLNNAFRLLMKTPQPYLIALGMTRYWKAADGLRLDVAPFVTALAHASGVSPLVLGKPSVEFYQMALQRLAVEAENTIMVGDDIRGDIGGAKQCGIRGILVRTGKFRKEDLASDVKPDAVLGSVSELPKWWENKEGSRR